MEKHESANTIPDYGEVAMKSLRFKTTIAVLLCSIVVILFGTIANMDGPESDYWDIVLIFIIAGWASAMPYIVRHDEKYKICKCLAGLELGVIHSEDDLVILMGMNRKYARAMIAGEFDYLITDKRFCRFIGLNRMEIIRPKQ